MVSEQIMISGTNANLAAEIHYPGDNDLATTLIISHGFRGSKEGGGRAVQLAQRVAALGYTVIRYDFTPLGSLTKQVAELAQVVNFSRANLSRRIILLGRSMGGSASLVYASINDGISGVCLWATPSDLEETFRLSLGEDYDRLLRNDFLVVKDGDSELTLAKDFIQDFANYNLEQCMDSLNNLPVLIIHGDADEIVPFHQAEKLFNSAGHDKELVVINGGDHQLAACHQAAEDRVLGWLTKLSLVAD
ncbi:MAG: Serine aminopeptidase [Firmicutes bacterium]|nr:Serine aminopeptidase [Bacillota bacterium]